MWLLWCQSSDTQRHLLWDPVYLSLVNVSYILGKNVYCAILEAIFCMSQFWAPRAKKGTYQQPTPFRVCIQGMPQAYTSVSKQRLRLRGQDLGGKKHVSVVVREPHYKRLASTDRDGTLGRLRKNDCQELEARLLYRVGPFSFFL